MSAELRNLETKGRGFGGGRAKQPRGMLGGGTNAATAAMVRGLSRTTTTTKRRVGGGLQFGSKPKPGKEKLAGRLGRAESYLMNRGMRPRASGVNPKYW